MILRDGDGLGAVHAKLISSSFLQIRNLVPALPSYSISTTNILNLHSNHPALLLASSTMKKGRTYLMQGLITESEDGPSQIIRTHPEDEAVVLGRGTGEVF